MRAASLKTFENTKFIWLDLLERSVILIMFVFFAMRMYVNFKLTYSVPVLLLVLAEILPVILVIFRKWSNSPVMSTSPLDWFLALVAANAPLLAAPGGTPGTIIPQAMCSLIIISGFLIQISAKIILWRSFGVVPAAREIKVLGPYRIVRHPMYVGYILQHIGFLLAYPMLWNLAVYSGALVVQVARILREERILNGESRYREFAAQVRYRLLPGVF